MFKKIEEYILNNREYRTNHLKLDEPCIEIGGLNSTYYKGLLAHHLKTTIPDRLINVMLCHGCGNSKCSNPNHLYWGTRSDNEQDKKLHGTFKTVRQLTIDKYGQEKADIIFKEARKLGGQRGGGSNKLSEKEINEKLNLLESVDLTKFGWVKKASEVLNLSHTQTRRFVDKYYKKETYKR